MPRNKIQPASEGETSLGEPTNLSPDRIINPLNSPDKLLPGKNEQLLTESDGFSSSRSTASMIHVLAAQLKKPEPQRKVPRSRFLSAVMKSLAYIFFSYMNNFIEKGEFLNL
jgi:hypothetical protein